MKRNSIRCAVAAIVLCAGMAFTTPARADSDLDNAIAAVQSDTARVSQDLFILQAMQYEARYERNRGNLNGANQMTRMIQNARFSMWYDQAVLLADQQMVNNMLLRR